MSNKQRPRLCLVSQMPGDASGSHSITQAQLLKNHFEVDGYTVMSVSSKSSRVGRLLDVVFELSRARGRIDVLIIEVYSGLSFVMADLASLVGRFLGIPSIFVLHGGNLPEFASSNPRWVRRVLSRARVITAPSKFLANAFVNAGYEVRVIPNVIRRFPTEVPLRSSSQPKVLWMRSFHPIYNPIMAVDAFAIVKGRFPEAVMIMAGSDKGREAETKRYVAEKGLGGCVTFPGFLDESKKPAEFAAANVYINTNTVDNSPVSVIEAWSYGVPVVSTDVGGIPNMIRDGFNGFLVRSGDALAMADRIEEIFSDNDLAGSLSRGGREEARRSTWESVAPMWASIIGAAVNEPE